MLANSGRGCKVQQSGTMRFKYIHKYKSEPAFGGRDRGSVDMYPVPDYP